MLKTKPMICSQGNSIFHFMMCFCVLFFFCFFFPKYEISLEVQSTLRQSNVECVLIRESSDLMPGWNSPHFKNKCWCPIDERVISCCIPFWLVVWSVSFIASVLLYNAGPLLEATINVSSQFFHLRNLSPFWITKVVRWVCLVYTSRTSAWCS